METVLVLLDPGKLNNPDLDLRYRIPDLVEQALCIFHSCICMHAYLYYV